MPPGFGGLNQTTGGVELSVLGQDGDVHGGMWVAAMRHVCAQLGTGYEWRIVIVDGAAVWRRDAYRRNPGLFSPGCLARL